ncbi:hypothetical protein ST47_g4000 [Ascochyta rabiei]|uniref:Rhodopsin domain-containing protein n=1 Tax=Didymella rabiei TaxID=5454 RepID=A0A163GHP9_DIDRA|nr:hypothetical protein ST47_g4000 [Ascochyta rabiei]
MLHYGDPGYMEQDRSLMLYSITFTFLAASICMVVLRLYCQWFLLRSQRATLSEILIVISLFVDIASSILIHFQIYTGMGKHIEYSRARPAMLKASMKIGLAQNTCYQALIGLVKMSILAQFYQFAQPGLQKRVVAWVGAFVCVFMLFTVFAAIFQCIPMKAAWDLQNFPRGCWNMMNVNFFTSSMNTFLDLVVFLLPITTIYKLPTTFRKKLTLALAYSMGLLALACSVVRVRNIVFFNGEGDFTVFPLAPPSDHPPGSTSTHVFHSADVDAGVGGSDPGPAAAERGQAAGKKCCQNGSGTSL